MLGFKCIGQFNQISRPHGVLLFSGWMDASPWENPPRIKIPDQAFKAGILAETPGRRQPQTQSIT